MKTLTNIIIGLVLTIFSYSNNLQVTSATRVQITGDAADAKSGVQFSISWDNSWFVSGAPANHDAAWVFIKFRECGDLGADWEHALLEVTSGAAGNPTAGNHTTGANLVFAKDILSTDKWGNAGAHNTGAMLRRSSVGKGNLTATSVTLKVTGFTSATAFDPSAEYDIKVIGIEMVQIPQATFYIGDGYDTGNAWCYRHYDPNLPGRQAKKIESEGATDLACPRYDGHNAPYLRTLNISYPKGYDGFYIMKYELTFGQYVDFLNSINSGLANNRELLVTTLQHSLQKTGDIYSSEYPDRAKNYLSADDLLTYLDWSALRPMTDMEFEKASRGPLVPRQREYAWGSTAGDADLVELKAVTQTVAGEQEPVLSAGEETNINIISNAITGGTFPTQWNNDEGPIEVGLFARNSVQTRITTGATYYGAMEMSGNVSELCISTHYDYDTYFGTWGDGNINGSGKYDVADWPTDEYVSYKGGSWIDGVDDAEISHVQVNASNYTTRTAQYGGRGVR